MTTLGVVASVLALIVLFTGATLLGRRMAGSRGSVRATTVAIASAVALFVVIHPFNILIDIDNQDFAGLIVLVEFALLPAVAGVVAWSAAEQSRRRPAVVASVVPVLALTFSPSGTCGSRAVSGSERYPLKSVDLRGRVFGVLEISFAGRATLRPRAAWFRCE